MNTAHLRTYTRDPSALSTIGTTITLRITVEQAEWLRSRSQKFGVNVSWLVRKMIEAEQKRFELTPTPKRITTKKAAGNGSRRKTKRG
jgi:hypothetical protein